MSKIFTNYASTRRAKLRMVVCVHVVRATVNELLSPCCSGHGTACRAPTKPAERGLLFVAEGDHRVNAECAAGWDVAREESDGDEEDGYGSEGYGVASAHGEQQARE